MNENSLPLDYSGKLLIASPALRDPQFRETVVLMLAGTSDGALGLVLNRQSDKNIREIWKTIFKKSCAANQTLYIGGPVFGPLMVLHTQRDLGDIEVFPHLYFSTDKDTIERLVEENLLPFKLFIGNSGWGKKQLEREWSEGSWFCIPATLDSIFGDDTEIWRRSLEEAGHAILQSILAPLPVPKDPSFN